MHWHFARGAVAALAMLSTAGAARAQQPGDTADRPISLGDSGANFADPAAEPVHLSGFGVASYRYDGRTSDNTFAAGKLAVGLFRPIAAGSYVFGQLTTAVEDAGSGTPETRTEIDNLLLSVTLPGASAVALEFGKLDLPIGFERDDEPLGFLASPSFNFSLARPVKMTGILGTWAAGPRVEVSAFVFNGWDSDLDPNRGKSVGARVGLQPAGGASVGLSGLYGSEGDSSEARGRYLLTLDYSWQPAENWILAGEANLGGDRGAAAVPATRWTGATGTLLHQLTRSLALVARAEVLRDRDGARTGTPQTLSSFTLAPLWSFGVGREGIFANVPHTRYRIPRLQVRAELRANHSTEPVFTTTDGASRWGLEYRLQAVTTF